jgi:hypothetical protein
MTRELFSPLSDEHAQALVGGCVSDGVPTFVCADEGGWHHLGAGHVDPSDDVVLEAQAGAGVTAPTDDLHNFDGATAGGSAKNPTNKLT